MAYLTEASVRCAAERGLRGRPFGCFRELCRRMVCEWHILRKIPWNMLRGSLQTTYRSEASERRATSAWLGSRLCGCFRGTCLASPGTALLAERTTGC